MTRAAALLATLLVAPLALADVEYQVELGHREAHQAELAMTVRNAASPLELSMPVWTPGAYELRTWGRNVTPLAAESRGRPLTFRRTGPSTFRVEGHERGAEVIVRYRVYAPILSDDASQVDGGHAYLNGTSMFLEARGAEASFHRVRVAPPSGWRVASALAETPSGALEALGYEALVDAPIEVGPFARGEVRVSGRPYRVVLDGAPEVPPGLLRDVAALAEAETHAVGPPPYPRYLLLIHLTDGPGRMAALEHAASASVLVPHRSLAGGEPYDELLYVIAHELFHAWNARRLRPAELQPVDFQHPRPSRSLWITEGVTEYYAFRAMHASGRWSRARYVDRLSEEASRALAASRRGLTLEEDAELAWQPPDDAAGDPDAYYARGHLVALALDAALRSATAGRRSLDDVLRALLERATRQGGTLALDGEVLARAIGELAPEVAPRVAEWTQQPAETERLDAALSSIGLKLSIISSPPRTSAGISAELDASGLRVVGVQPDGPAAHAGLRPGDRILFLDGAPPGRRWAESLQQKPAGARLLVEAMRATRRLSLILELAAMQTASCRLLELPAPPAVALLREAWLK